MSVVSVLTNHLITVNEHNYIIIIDPPQFDKIVELEDYFCPIFSKLLSQRFLTSVKKIQAF